MGYPGPLARPGNSVGQSIEQTVVPNIPALALRVIAFATILAIFAAIRQASSFARGRPVAYGGPRVE
jgi:hypothetical protein